MFTIFHMKNLMKIVTKKNSVTYIIFRWLRTKERIIKSTTHLISGVTEIGLTDQINVFFINIHNSKA